MRNRHGCLVPSEWGHVVPLVHPAKNCKSRLMIDPEPETLALSILKLGEMRSDGPFDALFCLTGPP